MKKILIFILCAVWTIMGTASNPEHLNFENIPISGSASKFIKKLKGKGYKNAIKDDYICLNDGVFQNSIVRIMGDEERDHVYGICVFLPSSNVWDTLSDDYDHWKTYLIQLYGVPTEDNAEFTTSNSKTPQEKIQALKDGLCSYRTMFKNEGGMITLLLNYSEEFGCRPQLLYFDRDYEEFLLNMMPHLNFMGIPITGSIEPFIHELENKKLKYITTYNDRAILIGDFAGYKNCHIYVEGQNIVSSVAVTFPTADSWHQVYSNYYAIKSMLIKKYGEPTESTEEFQANFKPSDNQMKWEYAISGRCKYNIQFDTNKGSISLSIQNMTIDYRDYCYVQLIYLDGINALRSTAKAMDDL